MMPGMIRFLMAVWLAILSFDGLVAEGFDHGSAVPELRAHCREKYTQRIAILNQIDGSVLAATYVSPDERFVDECADAFLSKVKTTARGLKDTLHQVKGASRTMTGLETNERKRLLSLLSKQAREG